MTPAAVEAASVDAVAFRAGAACAAWAMPMSEECVPQTRRLLRQVAADLGLSGNPDLVDAIRLVATEMTTNALQHGGKRVVMREGRPVAGLPELWVYLRGSAYREMVLTVYDTGSGWRNNVEDAGAADELREDGRGLKILTELAGETGGRWGRHPTRSRLGKPRLPGTAVWFALPLPTTDLPTGPPVGPRPGDAIGRLAQLLRDRGVNQLVGSDDGERAVLSVAPNLNVWFRDAIYCWDGLGGPQRRPVGDVVDAAEYVVADVERARRCCEEN